MRSSGFASAAINDFYRVSPALAAHHACASQQACNRFTVERCRHHQQLEAYLALGKQFASLQAQRQREVGVETALVKLVEYHQAYAFERGIILQHACQNALGDDFDACLWPHFGIQAHAIAHGLTGCFTELAGQSMRGIARGDTARFQHQDFTPAEPGFIDQHQRHARGLARSGRRLEYHLVMLDELLAQLIQAIVDR